MRVILSPFGSHGDVHPFVGLGLALKRRGHEVVFLTNEMFCGLARSAGFEAVPLGDDELFEQIVRDPDLWHPRKAFKVVARALGEGVRRVYALIEERYVPGRTVAVGGTIPLGVRVAHDKLGIPAATVHLQPSVVHSNVEPPVYPGLEIPKWWPIWLRRRFFDMIFRRMVDPEIRPSLNAFRAGLGLPPVDLVMLKYIHAPQLSLGFFPAWFGPPQPDWPANVELVGFPLYDERDVAPPAPELDAFLADGDPPVAFTPGSANIHGRAFFEAAVDACGRLNRRGLLLTRFPEQIPADLPDSIRHVPFAPFSTLLPRCAALVHHGGIGTAAQGMAAGVPQLVMHLAHDQYDNAARLRRLGVGVGIAPKRFKGPQVAEALRGLLDSCDVARSCRDVAARFPADVGAMDRAAELIERLGRQ